MNILIDNPGFPTIPDLGLTVTSRIASGPYVAPEIYDEGHCAVGVDV
jgi:hypothetical protein